MEWLPVRNDSSLEGDQACENLVNALISRWKCLSAELPSDFLGQACPQLCQCVSAHWIHRNLRNCCLVDLLLFKLANSDSCHSVFIKGHTLHTTVLDCRAAVALLSPPGTHQFLAQRCGVSSSGSWFLPRINGHSLSLPGLSFNFEIWINF